MVKRFVWISLYHLLMSLFKFLGNASIYHCVVPNINNKSRKKHIATTCRGRSLGFLRLGWTLAFEFEPARGSGTIFPEMYPTFLSAKNNPLRNRIYFPWPQERAAKFAPKCTPPFKAQKITPYEAEFIFCGLGKGQPNLHRNVRYRFKLRK